MLKCFAICEAKVLQSSVRGRCSRVRGIAAGRVLFGRNVRPHLMGLIVERYRGLVGAAGMNMQNSILKADESGEPPNIPQAKQIRGCCGA